MAGIALNTNLPALQTNRRLGDITARLQRSFERLSSGLRISRAADDAAGLSISESLRTDSRVFSQGVRNLNDGVSITNIADSTLGELANILTRLTELAEQSANGTLGSVQRRSIDAEAQALTQEYFRISRVARFNGLNLFDGSTQSLRLQAGYGTNGSVTGSVGGKLGNGSFQDAEYYLAAGFSSAAVAIGDLNGDGLADLAEAGYGEAEGTVLIRLGNGDGTFRNGSSYDGGGVAVSFGDLNNDGLLDLVSLWGGSASVRLGNGDGSFRSRSSVVMETGTFANSNVLALGDLNNDGIIDLVTAGDDGTSGRFTARLGTGTGSFGAALSFTTEANESTGLALGDLNGDGLLDVVTVGQLGGASVRLGNGDGSFGARTAYSTENARSNDVKLGDVNGDGRLDLVSAGYDSGFDGCVTIRLGNGNGSLGSAVHYAMDDSDTSALALGDLDGDGLLDIVTGGYGGYASMTVRLGNGNGSFQQYNRYESDTIQYTNGVALGDLNTDGVLDIVSAGNNVALDTRAVWVNLQNTEFGIAPLLPFSLRTKADALQTLPFLKQSLTRVSAQRGSIGALQSRLSSALATLGVARENFESARSAITDVDVASESASLLKNQILQQAASSILSQANQAPALALKLLSG